MCALQLFVPVYTCCLIVIIMSPFASNVSQWVQYIIWLWFVCMCVCLCACHCLIKISIKHNFLSTWLISLRWKCAKISHSDFNSIYYLQSCPLTLNSRLLYPSCTVLYPSCTLLYLYITPSRACLVNLKCNICKQDSWFSLQITLCSGISLSGNNTFFCPVIQAPNLVTILSFSWFVHPINKHIFGGWGF